MLACRTTQPDPRTIACLERLIAFNTVSRNSNLDCIDWARALLEAHGARTRMDWNADRTKANMLATFGEGPGGTVLSGHVDVAPVDGQDWSSDPFTATLRCGRIYGRGACDMKGFDAVVLAHAADYAAADLRAPIHVALTYDEELGCLGIPHLIRALGEWNIHPTGCIVGEPTSMRLAHALVTDKTVDKVGYGTEASFFQLHGVPSLVCGPGSIVQAHKADEYVAQDQLAACDRFIEGLVAGLSSATRHVA